MILVFPFSQKDIEQAKKLAWWIRTLQGERPCQHQCVVVHCASTPADEILAELRPAFRNVVDMAITDNDPGTWPQGPNLLFRRAAIQIAAKGNEPFLWMEPDAIPLHPDWLEVIDQTYHQQASPKRPFFGAIVNPQNTPPHMTGIAVYPKNAAEIAPLLVRCEKAAFDMNSKSQVLPRVTQTTLIQHEWRPAPFKEEADLKRLRPGAVIYHQDKDGGLIELLYMTAVHEIPKRAPSPFARKPAVVSGGTPAGIIGAVSGPSRALSEGMRDDVPAHDENFAAGGTRGGADPRDLEIARLRAELEQRDAPPTEPSGGLDGGSNPSSSPASEPPPGKWDSVPVADLRAAIRALASSGKITGLTGTQIASMNRGECLTALAPHDEKASASEPVE